jgi:hypothetical protein
LKVCIEESNYNVGGVSVHATGSGKGGKNAEVAEFDDRSEGTGVVNSRTLIEGLRYLASLEAINGAIGFEFDLEDPLLPIV